MTVKKYAVSKTDCAGKAAVRPFLLERGGKAEVEDVPQMLVSRLVEEK
jgi:hypothetical protein